MSNYNDFDFCDHTRGTDNLLDRYEEDREEIVDLAKTDPELLTEVMWEILSVDNSCKCNLVNPKTSIACSQCKNLMKVLDIRSGGINKVFPIHCGNSTGKLMKIVPVQVDHLHLKRDDLSLTRAEFYRQQYSKLNSC